MIVQFIYIINSMEQINIFRNVDSYYNNMPYLLISNVLPCVFFILVPILNIQLHFDKLLKSWTEYDAYSSMILNKEGIFCVQL